MTVDQVMEYRRAVPFKPFVLVLTDGRRFEVREPTAIGRNSAFTRISVVDKNSGEGFDISRVSHVELLNTDAMAAAGNTR